MFTCVESCRNQHPRTQHYNAADGVQLERHVSGPRGIKRMSITAQYGHWTDRLPQAAGQVLADLAERLSAIGGAVEVHSATAAISDDWPEIRATLKGNGEAFARLVERYQDTIAAQMWRFSHDRSMCEELTHEVFVEAYVSLRRYRGDAPLVHWLRRIATRVGYRYYKRQANRRAEGTISLQDWDQTSTSAVPSTTNCPHEAAEAATIVHALLAKLPPRDRLVLTLIYLEGCSIAEAAELVGWSQTMVKVQAHRARKKMKKLCDQVPR
jgi:RNA polymerase sigma-70 factor (ECF subfamily)